MRVTLFVALLVAASVVMVDSKGCPRVLAKLKAFKRSRQHLMGACLAECDSCSGVKRCAQTTCLCDCAAQGKAGFFGCMKQCVSTRCSVPAECKQCTAPCKQRVRSCKRTMCRSSCPGNQSLQQHVRNAECRTCVMNNCGAQ
uniref:Uncharacterized protein n=1 Tax=Ciona savignyi TaxID=51511 RepID=H2YCB3_CIOSA